MINKINKSCIVLIRIGKIIFIIIIIIVIKTMYFAYDYLSKIILIFKIMSINIL